jgi:hypothetical protein
MNSRILQTFRVIALVAFLVGITYGNLFGQQINTISSRCPSPNQLTRSTVKALASGNISYTPCSGFSSIFYGLVDMSNVTAITTGGNFRAAAYDFNNLAGDATFKFILTPATDGSGFFRLGNASTSYFQINESSAAVLQTPLFVLDAVSDYNLKRTVTATGTTGNATINKPAGSVNFAAGATQISVTNSIVTVDSIVMITQNNRNASPDATCIDFNVSAITGGSFKIVTPVACTAETRVSFLVFN